MNHQEDDRERPDRRPGSRRGALRTFALQSLALVGMAGVAVTQPVLDLFGRNPEFFVSGRYSSSQIIAFAFVVALVPPVIASLLTGLGWLIHPRVGTVIYGIMLAALAAAFGLALLNTLGLDALLPALIAAVAIAAVIVWLERTRKPVRMFLSYLAVGNLAFVVLFLVGGPTSDLLRGGGDGVGPGTVQRPALDGPVILVIFDEFPVTTLMRPDGTINSARFPNFARLADVATWFRNASSRSPLTHIAVPSILTGRLPQDEALPTHDDYPRNYFTLLGAGHPVNRYELLTDMCPSSLCDPKPRNPLSQAIEDASVVYGHRVLPESWRNNLPPVDQSWGNFSDQLGEVAAPVTETSDPASKAHDPYARWRSLSRTDRSALGQAATFTQMVDLVDATPSVNLIHVALPHSPFTLTPWGDRLFKLPRFPSDLDDPGFEWGALQRYSLHSMQAGAADVALGGLLDRLQETGAWDDSLVVAMSDHGLGLLPPDFGRKLTDRNREELLRVPLFIKAPGQRSGEVRDDVAQTIDVLPSIADLLDVETDWEFDGHSLYDGSDPTVDPPVEPTVQPALDIVEQHAATTPHGDDWVGLAAVGEPGDLVGKPVVDVTVGKPSSLTWTLDAEDALDSLPTHDGRVPQLLTGTVATKDEERPPELVVEINGTLAGVVGAYNQDGNSWRFSGFMGPFFRDGANKVVGYEVERSSGRVVLHPLGESD